MSARITTRRVGIRAVGALSVGLALGLSACGTPGSSNTGGDAAATGGGGGSTPYKVALVYSKTGALRRTGPSTPSRSRSAWTTPPRGRVR